MVRFARLRDAALLSGTLAVLSAVKPAPAAAQVRRVAEESSAICAGSTAREPSSSFPAASWRSTAPTCRSTPTGT